MTKALYNDALKRVLVHEGGYVNHPADPGGATNKGVTQRTFNAYLDRTGKKRRSVKTITAPELQAIYRTQYADLIHFDQLPPGVDYIAFDGAVNSGPAQSAKWLQRALRPAYRGIIDGEIGNATLEAATNHPDHDRLINDVLELRLAFLKHLKAWPTFGRGWRARLVEVESGGQAWASGSIPSPAEYHAGGAAFASRDDAAMPAAPTGGPTVGAGGGVASVALETTRQSIEPLAGPDAPPIINKVLLILVLITAAIALGGVAWGLWAKYRTRKVTRAIDGDEMPGTELTDAK